MTQNIEIPWQVTFPEKDAVTRYVRPSLVAACHGNERMAEVLDYIIHTGSWEAKNQGLPKGCNVVKIHRTHKEILSHLKVKPSRKTLIHYFDLFNEWGYVLSERYQRDLLVHFDTIQKNINTPPASDQKPGCHHRLYAKGCSSSTLQHSENEDDETAKKVVALQQKVVTLQQKVEELQQKVVSQETLQRDFEALQKRVEDLFFSPTTYYCLLPSFTNEDTLGDGSLNANVTPPLVSAGTETDTHSHDDTSNLPALFESLATAGDPIATDDVPTTEEQDAREQAETLRALVEAGVVQVTSPVSEPAVESVTLTEDAPQMSGECPVSDPLTSEQPMQETLMPEASAPQVALTEEEWLTERALHERKLLSLWKECKSGTRLKAQYATWVICRRAELAIWERSHKKPSKADALWAQLTPAEQEGVRRWHSLSRGAVITREDVEGAQLFTTSGVALTQEQMRDERDWLRENQQGWFGFAGTKRGRVSYRDLAEHAAGWFDALEHPASALPPQQRGNGNLRIVRSDFDDPNYVMPKDDFYPSPAEKKILWAEKAAALAAANR